jgi:WD40-like Beta Propeller Repeat
MTDKSRWHVFVRILLLIVASAGVASIALAGPRSFESLPTDASGPHLFGEGVISTPGDEAGGVFSPDGNEFYFVLLNPATTFPRIGLLCVSHWRDGKWSTPEALPFSGKYLDFPPRLSPDGKTMYFGSSRPAPESKARVMRIWKAERKGDAWSEPQPLAAPVNLEDHWDWGGSVTNDGTMYFTSDRDASGRPQIYRARLVNGAYQTPEKLGPEINSEFNEYDPYVNGDESLLLFVSAGEGGPPFRHRADTVTGGGFPYARGDIYFSRRVDGKWTQAKHVERGVNSVADESVPALTPDGKFLIFASERSPFVIPMPKRIDMAEFERLVHSTLNGHGNIYTIPVSALGVSGGDAAKRGER